MALKEILAAGREIVTTIKGARNKIAALQESGTIFNLGKHVAQGVDLGSILSRIGLGLGDEGLPHASRSRVVKMIQGVARDIAQFRSGMDEPLGLQGIRLNRDLFSEGYFGRRVRLSIQARSFNPRTGQDQVSRFFADFPHFPTQQEIYDKAISLSQEWIRLSPKRFEHLMDGGMLNIEFDILDAERAF